MPRLVTAFSNATVKRLRSLRDKKARRAEGLFLAEGLRIIAEARDSWRLPEVIAFSAEGARHKLAAEIIAATEEVEQALEQATERLARDLTDEAYEEQQRLKQAQQELRLRLAQLAGTD